MTDPEKILYLLDYLKLNKHTMGKLIGDTSGARLQNVIAGRNKISKKLANDITTSFPQVNLNWLLAGIGEPINTQIENTDSHTKRNPNDQKIADRLIAFMDAMNYSITEFAEVINVPVEKLRLIISKQVPFDLSISESIIKEIPAFSLNWLILGEGPMLDIKIRSEQDLESNIKKDIRTLRTLTKKSEWDKKVALISKAVGAPLSDSVNYENLDGISSDPVINKLINSQEETISALKDQIKILQAKVQELQAQVSQTRG